MYLSGDHVSATPFLLQNMLYLSLRQADLARQHQLGRDERMCDFRGGRRINLSLRSGWLNESEGLAENFGLNSWLNFRLIVIREFQGHDLVAVSTKRAAGHRSDET